MERYSRYYPKKWNFHSNFLRKNTYHFNKKIEKWTAFFLENISISFSKILVLVSKPRKKSCLVWKHKTERKYFSFLSQQLKQASHWAPIKCPICNWKKVLLVLVSTVAKGFSLSTNLMPYLQLWRAFDCLGPTPAMSHSRLSIQPLTSR